MNNETFCFQPTVSVGNVGQLAMDIFLNKTGAEHVGYLHDDSILPVVGNHPLKMNAAEECTLTTSAQGNALYPFVL